MSSAVKKLGVVLMLGMLAVAAFFGCKNPLVSVIDQEVTVAVTPPEVISVFPEAGSVDVAISTSYISIEFTKSIASSSVSSTSIVITDSDGKALVGSWSVDDKTVTFTPNGSLSYSKKYTITITANLLDTDGNSLTENYSWSFTTGIAPDTEKPDISSVLINGGSVWARSLTLTVDISATDNYDTATATSIIQMNINNTGWKSYSPSSSFTLSAGEGARALSVRVKDASGNESDLFETSVNIDTVKPVINNFRINDGASATNSPTVDLEVFTSDENSSGVTQFRYRLEGGSWSSWSNLTVESGSGEGSVSGVALTAELGEVQNIELEVVDTAGNVSTAETRSILYEQTPPTIVDVSWDDDPVFPYNASLIKITFDEEMASESFTEGTFSLIRVSDSHDMQGMVSLEDSAAEPDSVAKLWGLELGPNTQYKVSLENTVTDIAGNQIGGSEKNWFFSTGDAVDSSPPSGAVTLTGAVTLPSGATATGGAVIELDFSAITDDYNEPYGIKLWGDNDESTAGEEFFEQDAGWRSWPATDKIAWHLSTASGTKYVLYKLMDSAGNESDSPNQMKIILDNHEDPVINSVVVNDGATHTNDSERKVDISISAEDEHSGIKEMIISNLSNFSGADWQDYEPLIEGWVLPDSDASHNIYIKVRDYLDEESDGGTYYTSGASPPSIVLDRTAPQIDWNVQQILINDEDRLEDGAEFTITESFGIAQYLWSQQSGNGTIYFNVSDGRDSANDGTGIVNPYVYATIEDDYFIRLELTDNAGNTAEESIAFTWDETPPGNISNLAVADFNNTGQPLWSWDAGAGADFYRTSYEADFDPYIDVDLTTFSPNQPLTPDGIKTLYVRAQDYAGNSSQELSASVHVDTVDPTISVTNWSYIANEASPSVVIDFTGADGSVTNGGTNPSNIESYLWEEVSVTGNLVITNAGTLTPTVSATADDNYQLGLTVTDEAGNQSSAEFAFLRDVTRPNAPSVDGPSLTPNLRPTWYWSSGGGGIGEFRYKLINIDEMTTIVDWTSTTALSFTVGSDLADQYNYRLSVEEKDAAENWSLESYKNTEVDTTQTTPAQISIGDAYPALRTVNTMTWNLLTGYGSYDANNKYRYQLDGSAWVTVDDGLDPSTPTAVGPFTGLDEGSHTLTVEEFFNSAWQSAKQASHTITVDTVPPNAPNLSGSGNTTSDADRTATSSNYPTWSWSSGGGGNGKFQYRIDGGSWVGTTSTSYSVNRPESTTLFEIQERDVAGHWSATSSHRITVDTTAPVLNSVKIRDPSPFEEDTDDSHTNTVNVEVDINGDISGEAHDVTLRYLDYNPQSAYETWGAPFTGGTMVITTELPSTNGERRVYAQLVDEAGNGSSYRNDSIILDTEAPSGTFTLNNGELYTPSLYYKMNLAITDNITQAANLLVRDRDRYNSAGGGDVYGSYRTYSTEMNSVYKFSISVGYKYGYVRVYDEAGNYTTFSDSVYMQIPSPTYARKGQYSGGYTYVHYNPVTDQGSGSYTTRYYVYSTTDPAADPNNGDPVTYEYNTTSTSSCYAAIPKGELRYFFVRAYDSDTGGWGPYSLSSVLGFSSNVTIIYDEGESKDELIAQYLKELLEDTYYSGGILSQANMGGSMPTYSVTLLPEDLVNNTSYNSEVYKIYGDPVIVTPGTTFTYADDSYDYRIRNIVSNGKGLIAMGYNGAELLDRVEDNWSAWGLSGTAPTQIGRGESAGLGSNKAAKTRSGSSSEDIWYSPMYNSYLKDNFYNSNVNLSNIFNTTTGDVYRYGVYLGESPSVTDGMAYAGDYNYTSYWPVVRQGRFLQFGYYDAPGRGFTGATTYQYGQVFFINLVARMDNY